MRPAARAIMVAHDGAVLLVRITNPDTGRSWWITPGGGLDAGETHEQALRRELREETGWDGRGEWLGCVWTREHVFAWRGTTWRQQERYFLVRVPERFTPSPGLPPEALAAEGLDHMRWWTPADLACPGEAEFAPRRFPKLVAGLIRDGAPGEPIDAGV